MSIIRAQGCVSRIRSNIVKDFVKTSKRGKNWKLKTDNVMISLLVKPNCMLKMFLANSKKSSGNDDKADCNGKDDDKWLAVNIVFPGITNNVGRNAPLLLQPHCSFFILIETKTKDGKLNGLAEELPLNFWATNQRWFDENCFVDMLFGCKEHGNDGRNLTDVAIEGEVEKLHYRPTRLFNVSEVGWLTDKVIEFVRTWCDV